MNYNEIYNKLTIDELGDEILSLAEMLEELEDFEVGFGKFLEPEDFKRHCELTERANLARQHIKAKRSFERYQRDLDAL